MLGGSAGHFAGFGICRQRIDFEERLDLAQTFLNVRSREDSKRPLIQRLLVVGAEQRNVARCRAPQAYIS